MAKKKGIPRKLTPAKPEPLAISSGLLGDVRDLINQARTATAQVVNVGLVTLYWGIGERIRREVLQQKRAEYGEQVVATLADRLTAEYGDGYSRYNLSRMVKFAERFPDPQIVATLSQQLNWSHLVLLLPLDDPLKRDFYAQMCRVERWSVRTLRDKIQGMLFERTGISRKPAELARQELATLRDEDRLTPDLVFRDPYLLDFLGLKDTYSEADLEIAILRELELFLIELGSDFAFIARQKRIVIDNEDYRIDLLFYHRGLRRLVAIDLKLGKFEPGDKGQMELYLRWLERHDQRPGEAAPLGLILCAEKGTEQVELLRLDESGIRDAEYLTELPPRPLLQQKLHAAIHHAHGRLKEKE